MNNNSIFLITLIISLTLLSCSKKNHPSSEHPSKTSAPTEQDMVWKNNFVRLIGAAPIAHHHLNTLVGGLSALSFSPRQGQVFILSDDPSKRGLTRMYAFFPRLDENTLKLIPSTVNFFKISSAKDAVYESFDGEGLIVEDNGGMWVSTESKGAENLRATLAHFSPKGEKEKIIAEFKNLPHNQGLESLAWNESTDTLWVASQHDADKKHSGQSQISVYSRQTHKLVKTLFYPRSGGKEEASGESVDLTELTWIKDSEFYALERPSEFKTGVSHTRLYWINFKDTGYEKKLILDFKTLPQLLGELNWEGMCLGPQSKSGKKTLLLVNDNDFRVDAPNVVMALEIL